MNILLWILQVLLAFHTVMGAIWKFSNPEQNVPSLSVIPHGMWISMSVLELIISFGLVIPRLNKHLALLAPIAALYVAAEMLLLSGVHLYSGDSNYSPMIYWLVVAAICGFIAYGRLVLTPFKRAKKK